MYKYFNNIRLFAGVFVILFSGCELQNKQVETQASQKPPKHVGYLRIPLNGVVTTIDPGLTNDLAHIELVEQLFLGLTDFDPQTYEAVPELATDWSVSHDGMVYTFRLRQNVQWTNGEPVTAHDVVWAIWRNTSAEETYSTRSLYLIKNAEALNKGKITDVTQLGIRAIDDYTVEFTLEHPIGYFPAIASLWTYRPLPRKVIEQYGEHWTEPQHIQTNGSYHLMEWNKGAKLILQKNPNYYEADKVKIPKVHYYIVPESSLGLAMYENNELDILGGQVYLRLPQTEIPRIKSDPILRKEKQICAHFCTEWYGFNVKRPPMDNPLVRKAIAASIDKQSLIDIVIKGNHSPATTFTRPPIFGSVDPKANVGIPFNPKQAQTWLAEAGYPQGQGFPPVILMHHTSEVHAEVAQGVKTILKHYLNINIEVRDLDFDTFLDTLNQPTTPHIFRMGWCTDYPDANNWLYEVFHPENGINWNGWNNLEFAEAVDKAQRISDPAERRKLYHRAEQILTEEEVAIVPIYFSNAQFLVKPWVKGWYNMAFGGQHIRYWSLEN